MGSGNFWSRKDLKDLGYTDYEIDRILENTSDFRQLEDTPRIERLPPEPEPQGVFKEGKPGTCYTCAIRCSTRYWWHGKTKEMGLPICQPCYERHLITE